MIKFAQYAFQIILCRLECCLADISFVFSVYKYGQKHQQFAHAAVKNLLKSLKNMKTKALLKL